VRLDFPATSRNRDPILDVLRPRLAKARSVLEIASGSGQHAAYFAAAMPWLTWQPTDVEDAHLASIDAWRTDATNVRASIRLDVTAEWPAGAFDVVYCANMVHIAPWEAAVGLFTGAARVLPIGGRLVTYGPYRRGGAHTAPSNEAFDASLKGRDPRWGVRDVDELAAITPELVLDEVIAMPANNFVLVFRRV
jgi:SAM-dependent methyltransferase